MEIKFRAWDKKSKKMRVVSCIVFDTISHLCTESNIKLVNLWGQSFSASSEDNPHVLIQRDPKDVVLMQYTRLKDKNGKEIYKGDIVKVEKDIGVIEFKEGVFCVRWKGASWLSNYVHILKRHIEVIGNIHENPGLLDDCNA